MSYKFENTGVFVTDDGPKVEIPRSFTKFHHYLYKNYDHMDGDVWVVDGRVRSGAGSGPTHDSIGQRFWDAGRQIGDYFAYRGHEQRSRETPEGLWGYSRRFNISRTGKFKSLKHGPDSCDGAEDPRLYVEDGPKKILEHLSNIRIKI